MGVGLSKCFFFTMNPSLRYFLLRGRGWGLELLNFFDKESKSKKKKIGGVGGRRVGVG